MWRKAPSLSGSLENGPGLGPESSSKEGDAYKRHFHLDAKAARWALGAQVGNQLACVDVGLQKSPD